MTLLWKNQGDHTFAPVSFDAIELYAYHFATAPGTFGRERLPAFADSYFAQANVPGPTKSVGISLYVLRDGKWERHRIWREKDGQASISAIAMGDVNGDGLDDVVFADNGNRRVRVLLQQEDGTFAELDQKLEPAIASLGQWLRLVDLNGDGRTGRRALAHGQLFGAERVRWLECLPESSEVTCPQTLGTKLMIGKHKKCFFPLTLGFSGAIIRSIARGPSAPTGTEIRFYEVF